MKMTRSGWTAGAMVALLVSTAPAWAQTATAKQGDDVDKLVDLLRQDVRSQKADIIAKTMSFDATQAAAFWPVYKAYEAERTALGDDRLAVIQDLAEHFDSLNDANAKGLLNRAMVIEEKRVALERRYADEFLKVLPGKTVARFFQVENRINNLINLKLSSGIPLVR